MRDKALLGISCMQFAIHWNLCSCLDMLDVALMIKGIGMGRFFMYRSLEYIIITSHTVGLTLWTSYCNMPGEVTCCVHVPKLTSIHT